MELQTLFAEQLRDCSIRRSLEQGRKVHLEIDRAGYGSNRFLGNLVVHMYGQCGCVLEARSVFEAILHPNSYSWNIMLTAYSQNGLVDEAKTFFDCMPGTNVVSWNAMICAYADNGDPLLALTLFKQMLLEGHRANEISFISVIDACSNTQGSPEGIRLHELAHTSGFLEYRVSNALINMYGKWGRLADAEMVLNNIPEEKRSLVSWTSMITAYARNHCGRQALEIFHKLCLQGVKADEVCFVSVLDSCSDENQLARVVIVLFFSGFQSYVDVESALISSYSRCGSLEKAREIFDSSRRSSGIGIGSWNCIISAYSTSKSSIHRNEALRLFSCMDLEGLQPDEITLISAVEACSVFEQLLTLQRCAERWFESSSKLRSGFITRCGEFRRTDEAQAMFLGRVWSTPVWNSMIGALVASDEDKRAAEVLKLMDLEGVKANGITFISALQAASKLALVSLGKLLHEEVISNGLESNLKLTTSLITMYSRCACMEQAQRIFNKVAENVSVYLCSSMISALASNGLSDEAVDLFRSKVLEGLKVDRVALESVVYAWSQAGLVEEAAGFVSRILDDFGVGPGREMLLCLVDVLGKAGRLEDAAEVINSMAGDGSFASGWNTFLASCVVHGDSEKAQQAHSCCSSSFPSGQLHVQFANILRS